MIDKSLVGISIVLGILKILGFLDWSWVWVLSPIWIGAILWIILFIFIPVALLNKISGWVGDLLGKIFGRKK